MQQNNIATFGFRFGGFPQIIGPFGYTDVRAIASMSLYDRVARKNLAVAEQNIRAVQLSAQDARDLVVEAVANAYLTIIADGARVEAAHSQAVTAQVLYENARDRHAAGVSPAIDELRAQVEFKARQQRELAESNRLSKDKLVLGRVIGFASGQAFELADSAPYAPLEGLTPEEVIVAGPGVAVGFEKRPGAITIRRNLAASRARARIQRSGGGQLRRGRSEPGTIPWHLRIGGLAQVRYLRRRTHARGAGETDSVIQQRKNEIADLEGRIAVEVRSALLDLNSAADQVSVAQSSLDVANQTLTPGARPLRRRSHR